MLIVDSSADLRGQGCLLLIMKVSGLFCSRCGNLVKSAKCRSTTSVFGLSDRAAGHYVVGIWKYNDDQPEPARLRSCTRSSNSELRLNIKEGDRIRLKIEKLPMKSPEQLLKPGTGLLLY